MIGRRSPPEQRPRLRIFLWALLIAFICGAIEGGEPLEDVIKAGRDYVRAQPARGDIAVVAVDDRTGERFGGFAFSRSVDAQLVESLFAMGAKRVFFDRVYADSSDKEGDLAFARVLAKHRGRVFLGAASPELRRGEKFETLPQPRFRQATDYRSLNGLPTPFALSANLTFADRFAGRVIPSLSTELAGSRHLTERYYRPDWSIQMRTIPTASVVDVIDRRVGARSVVAGRDVVVGPTAVSLKDVHHILLQGLNPGVYFHVVGAETLQRGIPVSLGWLPAFAVAVALSALFLRLRRPFALLLTGMLALALFGVAPLGLDARLIGVDVVPASLMFLIVAYRATFLRRVENTRRTHPLSDLPNLIALQESDAPRQGTLVAVKLRNFIEIAASFSDNIERELFEELHRRIRVGGDAGTIYHGEDALVWFTDQPVGPELANHLMGLHKLSSRSVRIGDREIDLHLAFGVDADHERPLNSRVASAIMCAEEAARANDIWKLYDRDRFEQATWQLSLMGRLDQAIASGELWVSYQPKVDLATRRIIGAEALVRWTHPSVGAISPDQFVPAAEAHNRIEPLTYFVLERAIADLAALRARGHDVGVAVNLSSQMLLVPNLAMRVTETLERFDVPRAKLTLEVTETGQLISNAEKIAAMRRLAELGVELSIDDYGTGNATLEYLSRLPSGEVKIDRSFIGDLGDNRNNLLVVRSTLDLAHRLGRRVVAEGVEDERVLNILIGLGCDVAQGYHLGRPMPIRDLTTRLDEDWLKLQKKIVNS